MTGGRRRITRAPIDEVGKLSVQEREDMYVLLGRYYDGVTRETFDKDLDGKQHVIRLLDQDGRLAGFSTLQRLAVDLEGREVLTVFSGDTVIDEDCWGQKALQPAFARYMLKTKLERPSRAVYWFLISKGYKTYLLMRNNFPRSWPNPREATPSGASTILDAAARVKYPDAYDPAKGLIMFPRDQETQTVKESFQDLTEAELKNEEIRYFLARNPEYHLGDELCCIAKIRLRDLATMGVKYGVVHPVKKVLGLSPKRRSRPPATAKV